jgi:hypothetical protein
MTVADLKDEFQQSLSDFLWRQWAQMGVLAAPSHQDRWAADPEALLLLSFEVGREDPRLLEEALDWMLVNVRLLSTQRLRNLAQDGEDRALAGAAIDWVARWRRKRSPDPEATDGSGAEPLLLTSRAPVARPDPAFLEHGFLLGWREPQGRSAQPDLEAPINFALRLRSLLGVGSRAEVVRVLLSVDAPWMSVQAIAASTAFAKRNVQEAAASLRAAGAARSSTIGNEQRFELPREGWLRLLDLQRAPSHRDWPQLFRAYRVLLRWLRARSADESSEYLLASGARRILEEVADDLRFAGLPVDLGGPAGNEYWPHFEAVLRRLIAELE